MKIETEKLQMILANIRTMPQINMTKENRDTLTSIILELIKARHVQEDLIELLRSADDKIDRLEWKLMFAKKDEYTAHLFAKKKEKGELNEKNGRSQEEE